MIKEAVEKKNGMELKERISKLDKLEAMKEEKYEQRDYLSKLSLENARMLFRVRTKTGAFSSELCRASGEGQQIFFFFIYDNLLKNIYFPIR